MSAVEVKPIEGSRGLTAFIDLPKRLPAADPT